MEFAPSKITPTKFCPSEIAVYKNRVGKIAIFETGLFQGHIDENSPPEDFSTEAKAVKNLICDVGVIFRHPIRLKRTFFLAFGQIVSHRSYVFRTPLVS